MIDAAVDVHSETLATVQQETMGEISHGNKNQAILDTDGRGCANGTLVYQCVAERFK